MRCIECKTDPLTPGHYCECCGRKLSIEERTPVETAAVPDAASETRCGSCGGPSAGRDLCASCEQAFGPVLGSTAPATPPMDAEGPPAPEVKPAAVAPAPIKNDRVRPLRMPVPPMPVSPSRPTAYRSANRRAAWILLSAGAAVIVAAIAAPQGIRWFENQKLARVADEPQTEAATSMPETSVEGEPRATPQSTSPEAIAKGHEPAAARPRSTSSAPPKPATAAPAPARAPVPATAPREAKSWAEQVAYGDTSGRAAESAPASAPVSRPVAADARRAEPAAPAGRFFEQTDVDESPAIATRIDPKLPGDVPARLRNDIVIVRLLVSQSGHPFRVSLLRKSKAGPSVDDAVVAAVTRWTFSPARKRGEAVSCWLNVAVPLGQAL